MIARSEPPEFDYEVIPERDHVRVAPAGELDVSSAPVLEHAIRELRDSGFEHVIVDLRDVCFLDSTGLRLLLDLSSAARADAHRIELIAGPPEVQRVFELTGTLGALPFRDSNGSPPPR
jgi:anti-sigma B factor antagonist